MREKQKEEIRGNRNCAECVFSKKDNRERGGGFDVSVGHNHVIK